MFSSDIEQRKKPHVIVTLCNAPYLAAAVELVRLLRTKGGYKDGDIVVLYWGEDIEPKNQPELMSMGVIMQDVLEVMTEKWSTPPPPPCRGIISTDVQDKDNRQKRIRGSDAYYFKTAIFSSDYFGSRWERVLYMDSRMDIHRPSVMRFFDSIDSRGALMANPDSWPSQADNWKLSIQFWPDCNPSLYEKLRSKYFLDYEDYFQAAVMLYDTSILQNNTLGDIASLFHEYAEIIGNTDQCIFNLYWGKNMRNLYAPMPYRINGSLEVPYDFFERIPSARYIMTAWRGS